jgi:hypothetical protein
MCNSESLSKTPYIYIRKMYLLIFPVSIITIKYLIDIMSFIVLQCNGYVMKLYNDFKLYLWKAWDLK